MLFAVFAEYFCAITYDTVIYTLETQFLGGPGCEIRNGSASCLVLQITPTLPRCSLLHIRSTGKVGLAPFNLRGGRGVRGKLRIMGLNRCSCIDVGLRGYWGRIGIGLGKGNK